MHIGQVAPFGKGKERWCLPDGVVIREFQVTVFGASATRGKGPGASIALRRGFEDEITSGVEDALCMCAASEAQLQPSTNASLVLLTKAVDAYWESRSDEDGM